jgi:NTP pyrophosphatase (non-canonical NTP hydrolase)
VGYITDGLTFNTLRSANTARLPTFKNANGEICHPDTDFGNWSLTDWTTALAGEVGEAANIIKKLRRGDFTIKECQQQLADELADVQIYLDLLAKAAGIDLGRATIAKFNRKSHELSLPVFIREDGSDWTTGQI